MDHRIILWGIFFAIIAFFLAVDLGLFRRKSTDHVVSTRESLIWTAVWAVLAIAFGGIIWQFWDVIAPHSTVHHHDAALLYLTGWVVEYSLSMDNIFVMVLIFKSFGIPKVFQRNVLLWGILGALVLRGALIGAGAALVSTFHWVLYLFGAFLLFTGGKMLFSKDDEGEGDVGDSKIVRIARRFLPVTAELHGHSFTIRQNGKLFATPLLLTLIVIEFTDVIFAFDSIPAIFSITTEPILVFTSNIFAIMGLRSLYFLLAGMVDTFRFLKYGISTLLLFIGIKMLADHWLHITPLVSLLVIVLVLATAVIASLLFPAKKDDAQ